LSILLERRGRHPSPIIHVRVAIQTWTDILAEIENKNKNKKKGFKNGPLGGFITPYNDWV
jgi:hypothetical protein